MPLSEDSILADLKDFSCSFSLIQLCNPYLRYCMSSNCLHPFLLDRGHHTKSVASSNDFLLMIFFTSTKLPPKILCTVILYSLAAPALHKWNCKHCHKLSAISKPLSSIMYFWIRLQVLPQSQRTESKTSLVPGKLMIWRNSQTLFSFHVTLVCSIIQKYKCYIYSTKWIWL